MPVSINHDSYDKYEQYGVDAYLYCNATGRPWPKIQWRREKMLIKYNQLKYIQFGNALIIKRFDSLDLGNYTCTASNGFGAVKSVNVTLKKAGKQKKENKSIK